MIQNEKENNKVSRHTPISNRPLVKDFAIEEFVAEPPSSGVGTESSVPVDDSHEEITVAGWDEIDITTAYFAPMSNILRDIAEASFGAPPPTVETVHGTDDRVHIQNPCKHPWRMTALLIITAKDNTVWCGTAFFIGPRTLITAGHDVYIKSGVPTRDGWVKQINVIPCRYDGFLPYGSVTSTSFRTVVGWAYHGNIDYNYGAIILPTDLGKKTGWFGFGVYSSSVLLNTVGNIAGYINCSKLMYGWRKIVTVSNRRVYYNIDTSAGQSGSAVYRISGGGRYAFAIHNLGGIATNSGTRINSAVFNNMAAWK